MFKKLLLSVYRVISSHQELHTLLYFLHFVKFSIKRTLYSMIFTFYLYSFSDRPSNIGIIT